MLVKKGQTVKIAGVAKLYKSGEEIPEKLLSKDEKLKTFLGDKKQSLAPKKDSFKNS